MNLNSEQIRPDLSLEISPDQPLTQVQQREKLIGFLGKEHCKIQNVCGRRVFVYENEGKRFILLHRAISYLGGTGQHPIFKKRIQLPSWFKDLCVEIERQGLTYDVRFIGVYHYEGMVVFADFIKDTYLQKKVHNSSAHIYINDIYQAVKKGVFHKEDMFGNHIFVTHCTKLQEYLLGRNEGWNDLNTIFQQFNEAFTFGQWLYSTDMIREMHDHDWQHWQQGEWPGFYLEYKFNSFTVDNHLTHLLRYVGSSNKKKEDGKYDFDIWFGRDAFYGDLKASSVTENKVPGNDFDTFLECINRYGHFWLVVYEHETIKDSEATHYKATIERNQYIRSINPKHKNDDMSYAGRMKHSVCFVKMCILELNPANFHQALSVFNQGHQPDGSARKPKYLLRKRDMDQYVVFRYNYAANGQF